MKSLDLVAKRGKNCHVLRGVQFPQGIAEVKKIVTDEKLPVSVFRRGLLLIARDHACRNGKALSRKDAEKAKRQGCHVWRCGNKYYGAKVPHIKGWGDVFKMPENIAFRSFMRGYRLHMQAKALKKGRKCTEKQYQKLLSVQRKWFDLLEKQVIKIAE